MQIEMPFDAAPRVIRADRAIEFGVWVGVRVHSNRRIGDKEIAASPFPPGHVGAVGCGQLRRRPGSRTTQHEKPIWKKKQLELEVREMFGYVGRAD